MSSTCVDRMEANDASLLFDVAKRRWKELNERLVDFPKFQNEDQLGVSQEQIDDFQSKWRIDLPREIRSFIEVHNGRQHIEYGLSFRLATTDLLPLDQWRPYEIENENDDNFVEDLFRSLVDSSDTCADEHLSDDVREHLNIYRELILNDDGKHKGNGPMFTTRDEFRRVPCELLMIGKGMDDYAEQYLISVRSSRIYLAIHNIPEWKLIGTFDQWIDIGMKNVSEQHDQLKEQHQQIHIE